MLNQDELRSLIAGRMKDAGFELEKEGVKSSVLIDLFSELLKYVLEKNEVNVVCDGKPGTGKMS